MGGIRYGLIYNIIYTARFIISNRIIAIYIYIFSGGHRVFFLFLRSSLVVKLELTKRRLVMLSIYKPYPSLFKRFVEAAFILLYTHHSTVVIQTFEYKEQE